MTGKHALTAIGGALLLVATISPASLAAGPKVGTGGGTGIDETAVAPMTPEGLGYTADHAAQKEAQYEATVAIFLQALAASEDGGKVVPMAAPQNGSLSGWVSYHQKTNYNCLPAVGQSILHWDFGGYITPTVAAKQGTASQATGTITKGMGTTTKGTNDNNAVAYINGEYAANGSSWRYIPTNNTAEPDFKARIYNQIGVSYKPLYVRVDLMNVNYAWHQVTPAQHATAAIAYTSLATTTTIDDPFTHVSGGSCSPSWDGGSANTSCNWVDFSTHRYYLSKDQVRDSVLPMWF